MKIQSTFGRLILRLQAIYAGEVFELLPTVQPVSLVDQDVDLTAIAVPPLLGTPFSALDQVAPGAGTVLADTGALAAGEYDVTVQLGTNDTNNYEVQRRDAANAANVWAMRWRLGADNADRMVTFRASLLTNERLRVVILTAGTAATTHRANIWATLSS